MTAVTSRSVFSSSTETGGAVGQTVRARTSALTVAARSHALRVRVIGSMGLTLLAVCGLDACSSDAHDMTVEANRIARQLPYRHVRDLGHGNDACRIRELEAAQQPSQVIENTRRVLESNGERVTVNIAYPSATPSLFVDRRGDSHKVRRSIQFASRPDGNTSVVVQACVGD
jgi:hypothetical protein